MSYENPRIQLTDTTISAVIKMSDGNPGAATVLARMVREGGAIDPDDFMGGFGAVLGLDTHSIYGPDIWRLYKDVAGQDLTTMLGLLRAVQLGYLVESKLKEAIEDPSTLDVNYFVSQVRARLPNFGKTEA